MKYYYDDDMTLFTKTNGEYQYVGEWFPWNEKDRLDAAGEYIDTQFALDDPRFDENNRPEYIEHPDERVEMLSIIATEVKNDALRKVLTYLVRRV